MVTKFLAPPDLQKNFDTIFVSWMSNRCHGQCLADGAGFSFLPLAWSVQFRDWMLGCSHEKHSLFNFVLVDSSFEVKKSYESKVCV